MASSPTVKDVSYTYVVGLGIMVGTSPVIHPLNVVAAAAAKTQLTSGKSALAVYRGLGGNPPNTPLNYWNGLTGHLSKELIRSWGRIGGVVFLEPMFKEKFNPTLAPHILAAVMATYEVLFANPFDVWKSYRSTGLQTKSTDLFKGSIGNFGRQYGMWFVWSRSIAPINSFLSNNNIVDPNSIPGIALRSVFQSAFCTSITYPMELWLRTVQVRSTEYPVKGLFQSLKFCRQCTAKPSLFWEQSSYYLVFKDLVKKNGIFGMGLGMTSKFVGNAVLLAGANYMPMITAAVRNWRNDP